MDAVKYLKEVYRMCDSMEECRNCPLNGCNLTFPCKGTKVSAEYKDTEKCVTVVEKWSAEHPAKTRQSEFLKVFLFAPTDENGVPIMMPCHVDYRASKRCNSYTDCGACKKDYWAAEVE